MTGTSNTWPESTVSSVAELRECIEDLCHGNPASYTAWRGVGKTSWMLSTTIDRAMAWSSARVLSYAELLQTERTMLEEFRMAALQFATDTERQLLMTLDDARVWSAMALGRHSGLPTRILDWTRSPWVAAYFASMYERADDGTIWWFGMSQLEDVLHASWDKWGVPTHAEDLGCAELTPDAIARIGLNQRVLHRTAFSEDGPAWVTMIHIGQIFARMEAQQGFMTACGRLGMDHNDAIDQLPNSDSIPRGRIRIRARAKHEILNALMDYNVDARSLLYPGIDIAARDLATRLQDFMPRR